MKVDVTSLDSNTPEGRLMLNVLLAEVSVKNSNKYKVGRFCLVTSNGDRTTLSAATAVYDRAFGQGWYPVQDWELLGQMIEKFDVDSVKNVDGTYDASIGESCPIQGATRMEAIAKAIIVYQLGHTVEIDDQLEEV
jgi:hypothetical protein